MIPHTLSQRSTRKLFFAVIGMMLITASCRKTTIINNYVTNPDNYASGLTPTPESIYSNIPVATLPPSGGNLPTSYFIDIPSTPFNQLQQGSCSGCAVAMEKSIVDHVKKNLSYHQNSIIYSPAYLFNQVNVNPNDCKKGGSYLYANLDVLLQQGVCKISEMPYKESDCTTQPTNAQKTAAAANKILSYSRIDTLKTATLKQHIFSNMPIIVGFAVDNQYKNDYWNPNNANKVWNSFGTYNNENHAALLYGWDDSKHAFKMLNQWGSQWGSNGTIWVDYDLVANKTLFFEAFVIQNPASTTTTGNLDLTGDLNFGSIQVGTTATKIIQLTNSGTTNINVATVSIPSPFSVNWTNGNIAAGASQPVTITFAPTAVGNFNNSLTVISNAANSTLITSIIGTATQQPQPTRIISLSGNMSFGNVTVGQSSTKTLTISNNGNSALQVTALSMPTGFSGNYTGTIQPGSSATTNISFSPTSAQSYQGNITVSSNSTSGTNTILATGTGIGSTPTVTPALGTYGACAAVGFYNCPPSYGLGVINARVVSINTTTHKIVVEIKKCNGTPFNASGNLNVVNLLCGGSGAVSYGFGPFSAGVTSFQMTITDNNMTGTKAYVPFIVQGAQSDILYSAPTIVISY